MSTRSYSDVPNRIINLFLQETGERYDRARGLAPYQRMTAELLARFNEKCAYCGAAWEVEEHLVPRNRRAGGLHAWGNVVPACRPCNRAKMDHPWEVHLERVVPDERRRADARARIARFITDFGYDPDTAALLPVLAELYARADSQARALVSGALQETEQHLLAMKRVDPSARRLAASNAADESGGALPHTASARDGAADPSTAAPGGSTSTRRTRGGPPGRSPA